MVYRLVVIYFLYCSPLFALVPIVPENSLSQTEIENIIKENNFFLKDTIKHEPFSIWRTTGRTYGSHYLKDRTTYYSVDDVMSKVLSDSFLLQYKIEELYRGKLRIHSQYGKILPKLSVSFGEDASVYEVGKIFSGLFGFLLPANWLQLAKEKKAYKAIKQLLLVTLFDEYFFSKLAFIKQHQLIQDFEIRNFYFIHLQLLLRSLSTVKESPLILSGRFASEGTDMASLRGDIKLGFDDLAKLMVLEDIEGDRTVGRLNIQNLSNFPKEVLDIKHLSKGRQDKSIFLEKVVARSLELKVAKEYVDISKLNIGVVATGNSLSTADGLGAQGANFSFNFGYDSVPRILIAKSLMHTSKIDLKKEYLNILDWARRSYDLYTNSLGGYTEAKRSLAINRQGFYEHLDTLNIDDDSSLSLFILSFNQLLQSELKLNNALHGSLRAQALMDRFLLKHRHKVFSLLPEKGVFIKILDQFNLNVEQKERDKDELDLFFSQVKRSKELRSILCVKNPHINGKEYTDDKIKAGFLKNISNLLWRRNFLHKRKSFYEVVDAYVKNKNILLSPKDKYALDKRLGRKVTSQFQFFSPRE